MWLSCRDENVRLLGRLLPPHVDRDQIVDAKTTPRTTQDEKFPVRKSLDVSAHQDLVMPVSAYSSCAVTALSLHHA